MSRVFGKKPANISPEVPNIVIHCVGLRCANFHSSQVKDKSKQ